MIGPLGSVGHEYWDRSIRDETHVHQNARLEEKSQYLVLRTPGRSRPLLPTGVQGHGNRLLGKCVRRAPHTKTCGPRGRVATGAQTAAGSELIREERGRERPRSTQKWLLPSPLKTDHGGCRKGLWEPWVSPTWLDTKLFASWRVAWGRPPPRNSLENTFTTGFSGGWERSVLVCVHGLLALFREGSGGRGKLQTGRGGRRSNKNPS